MIKKLIFDSFFISLTYFLIIFKSWQNITERLHVRASRESILPRTLVAGISGGILAVLTMNIKFIRASGVDDRILSDLVFNGFAWTLLGLAYGLYYRKKYYAPA